MSHKTVGELGLRDHRQLRSADYVGRAHAQQAVHITTALFS
jgi:hypothetical protein